MPLEAADGLSSGLALGSAPLDVDAAPRIDLGLDECDRMDRAVEAPVAAAVESMPTNTPGRCRNRGGTACGREMVLGRKSTNVPDLAQDPGGSQEADARDRGEFGSSGLDHPGDLRLQLSDLEVEPAKGQQWRRARPARISALSASRRSARARWRLLTRFLTST